jgi:hypothetical protein
MPRIPRSYLHPPAGAYAPGLLRWGPAARPIRRTPVQAHQLVRAVPLQPSTSQAIVSGAGAATCQLGPAGLGNLWYPTQVTLSTTTGINTGLDSSVANLYLGPSGVATYLLGTVFGGNGIVAAALPNIQPGLYLIAQWTGGVAADQATLNVQGVMDAWI